MTPRDVVDTYGVLIHEQTADDGHVEFVCLCPECNKQKLYVNAETGKWVCFHCRDRSAVKYRSDLTGLLMVMGGMSFADAHELLRDEQNRRVVVALSEMPARFAPPTPAPPPVDEVVVPGGPVVGTPGEAYLRQRGIRPATVEVFAPRWCDEGRFVGRVVLPIVVFGVLVGYQGRSIYGREPKYLTEKVPGCGPLLFGIDQAAGFRRVVLVEGTFDAMRLYQHGVPAVAVLGKSISDAQIALLRRAAFEEAVLMLDPDVGTELLQVGYRLSAVFDVRVARLPKKDPADSRRADVLAAVEGALDVLSAATYFSA